MGALFLDGRQIGDDGRNSGRTFEIATRKPSRFLSRLDLGADARRLAAHLAKNAARRYLKNPRYLDAISLGLSASSARRILAVIDHKVSAPLGGNPLGTLVIPINLRGAQIYARWMRRFEERDAYLQAAE